jgi:hypothetical protein
MCRRLERSGPSLSMRTRVGCAGELFFVNSSMLEVVQCGGGLDVLVVQDCEDKRVRSGMVS